MRPLCLCDPHPINCRMRLLVAGMLRGPKGLCRDSEHGQDTGDEQSGVSAMGSGSEKTVG